MVINIFLKREKIQLKVPTCILLSFQTNSMLAVKAGGILIKDEYGCLESRTTKTGSGQEEWGQKMFGKDCAEIAV